VEVLNRPKRVAAFMGAFFRKIGRGPGDLQRRAAPAVIGRSYNNGPKAVKPKRGRRSSGACATAKS
jgi:hypothetical protein